MITVSNVNTNADPCIDDHTGSIRDDDLAHDIDSIADVYSDANSAPDADADPGANVGAAACFDQIDYSMILSIGDQQGCIVLVGHPLPFSHSFGFASCSSPTSRLVGSAISAPART
jgi:hypothetical protein